MMPSGFVSSSLIDSFICFCHKNHCFDLVTITFSNHVYDLLHFQMYVQFSTAAIEWLCLPLLVCEILMGRC